MEQIGFHWRDFPEIWCLGIFRKSVYNVQVALESGKNEGHFTRRHLWLHLAQFYQKEKKKITEKILEKIETHM